MNILIIGFGTIGKALYTELKDVHNVHLCDPDKLEIDYLTEINSYDIGFVCVPTDSRSDGSCDTSIVEKVIDEHYQLCSSMCIRSTVPANFFIGYNTAVVYMPEFTGATQHVIDPRNPEFIVVGYEGFLGKSKADLVISAYKEIYSADLKIFKTDRKTASLIKYMDNCWLATKVTFFNEFNNIAKRIGVDYDNLREGLLLDPRINPSHTFVYDNKPYYDSHCLNKDIPALISELGTDEDLTPLLISIFSINKNMKEVINMKK